MAKTTHPLEVLKSYIPEGSFEVLKDYIVQYNVQLTLTRKRKTILGDYRHPYGKLGHRITVNQNLNRYAFLITLLHELAHLVTYEQYGNRVKSHGKEWKAAYRKILVQFMALSVFPETIQQALLQSIHNPAASSCADEKLMRVLRAYDENPHNHVLVEQIAQGESFVIPKNRVFIMVEKIRTRYKCKEVATGKLYLFSGLYEVKKNSL